MTGSRTPTSDTTAEAAQLQRAALAAMTPGERAAVAFEMSALMRRMAIEGIRRREPDLSSSQITVRLIERPHGPDLAREVAASRASRGG